MLSNISIKARLIILILFSSLMMLLIGLVAIKGIHYLTKAVTDVYEGGVDSIKPLDTMVDNYNAFLLTMHDVKEGSVTSKEGLKAISDYEASISQAADEYPRLQKNPEQQKAWDNLSLLIRSSNGSFQTAKEILKQENKEKIEAYTQELQAIVIPITDKIHSLINLHVIDTHFDYQSGLEASEWVLSRMAWIIALSILLGAVFAYFIVRSINQPLSTAIPRVEKLTRGDLSVQFDTTNNDEVGKLLSAMQLMVEALRSTLTEVQSEVNVLSSSNEEIVSSVSQVASGTAETAAAVTETTTTVEELKQTAHVAADKAQDVLNSAEETLNVVKTSEKSLKATIEDMNQIQEKMRVISDSIVALSKNSLTILEIINTVNDLAEQSNLLAVNAAIEAAKAGEQGKSFGVVAQEIRILAEQSKAATVQVRSILNDIQNSTSAAVMATEQGSKAVTKGVSQSLQTGESIHSLSQSMSKVAQAAKQIAISSQQQLVGVDQVTIAMTNINEASNQHVEHMKQIETAITGLNSVGRTLKQLVDQYKLKH